MSSNVIDLTSDNEDQDVVIVSSSTKQPANVIDLTCATPLPAPTNNESRTGDIINIFQTAFFERNSPYPKSRKPRQPINIPACIPPADPPPVGALKCCICLSFASEGTELVALNCGHIYDTGCIDELFKASTKKSIPCPQCRKPFTKAKMVKLFTS